MKKVLCALGSPQAANLVEAKGRSVSVAGTQAIRPPFTHASALAKVRAAEDAWNSRDPERVAQAYTLDCEWRNRHEFFKGREAIIAFLRRKWARELDYRLLKELWAFTDNRISVRFEYESRDESGQWWRSHGNEHWEFDAQGLMQRRDASINDYRIAEGDRRLVAARETESASQADRGISSRS